jgi:hypothetical protein
LQCQNSQIAFLEQPNLKRNLLKYLYHSQVKVGLAYFKIDIFAFLYDFLNAWSWRIELSILAVVIIGVP